MRLQRIIWFVLLAVLMLSAACKREVAGEDGEQPTLGVFISVPGIDDTKAETGNVEALDFEKKIFSLQIWVFESESKEPVCHFEPTGSQLPTPGKTKFYSLSVKREFARNMPDVDVFVLANAAAVGCTLDGESTRDEVRDQVFGGSYFSIDDPVRYVSAQGEAKAQIDARLTASGLPMSGASLGVTVEGEDPVLRIPTITLQRAVSKLRYVFCKMDSADDDEIIITGVSLNGNLIPLSEKVFCPVPAKYAIDGDTYLEDVMTVTSSTPLATSEGPEKFVYAGQDASAYERLLQAGIDSGELTDFGTTYLRESDRRLTGYVSYLINPEEGDQPKIMPFEMDPDTFDHDFARNHTWTLYGYFLSGRYLQLSVRALPWDYNVNQVNFQNDAVSADQISLVTTDGSIEVVKVGKNAEGGDDYNVFIAPGAKARGSFHLFAPKTGTLYIRPTGDLDALEVTPEQAEIYKDNNPTINFAVGKKSDAEGDVRGKSITLSFVVELGTREVSANTEIFHNDTMTFILK